MSKQQKIGRLAFRVEGDKWTCYYAQPDTMEGAVWVASIMMGVVADPKRKRIFMDLMKDALGEFIEEKLGRRPDSWPEESAPESERSGSA